MKKHMTILAYAGLFPFLVLSFTAIVFPDLTSQAVHLFSLYSAVLLSFFGGIHWLDALNHNRTPHQGYVAMIPTLLSWICLIFQHHTWSLGLLSIGYLLILLYDKQFLMLDKAIVVEYTKLRMILTTVVVLTHALLIFIVT